MSHPRITAEIYPQIRDWIADAVRSPYTDTSLVDLFDEHQWGSITGAPDLAGQMACAAVDGALDVLPADADFRVARPGDLLEPSERAEVPVDTLELARAWLLEAQTLESRTELRTRILGDVRVRTEPAADLLLAVLICGRDIYAEVGDRRLPTVIFDPPR